MADGKKTYSRILVLALAPFYAAYGTWVIGLAFFKLVRWVAWTARLMTPNLPCPACGEANSLHGRWECRAPGCGATYLGAVDRCERCGAGAAFFPCANCGASILLRSGR
jgi:predicted RNA-binding Zn-ribbon protein involved in translation (DUF1610 family)